MDGAVLMCACEPGFTCARCLELERDDEDFDRDSSYSRPPVENDGSGD